MPESSTRTAGMFLLVMGLTAGAAAPFLGFGAVSEPARDEAPPGVRVDRGEDAPPAVAKVSSGTPGRSRAASPAPRRRRPTSWVQVSTTSSGPSQPAAQPAPPRPAP